jgi:hypothetical protein
MRLKTFLAGAAVAGGLSVAAPAVASANVMWCVGDPPVQVVAPSGKSFTVSTQIFTTGNKQHLSQLIAEAVISRPDGHGGTLVTVDVFGPAGQQITAVVSVNKYKVSAPQSGIGHVSVTVDVPVA